MEIYYSFILQNIDGISSSAVNQVLVYYNHIPLFFFFFEWSEMILLAPGSLSNIKQFSFLLQFSANKEMWSLSTPNVTQAQGQLTLLFSRTGAGHLPIIFLFDYGINEDQCQKPIQDNRQNFQRHNGWVEIKPSCISFAIFFP